MTTPNDIMYILRKLGDLHKQIKSVKYGDYNQIIAGQLSKNEYPLLWIESPEVQFIGNNDSMMPRASVSFVILIHSTPDDYIRQSINQDLSYHITNDIIFKLIEISEADIRDVNINYLPHSDADNSQGYRVTMKIDMDADCDDIDSKYSDTFDGSVPFFTWKITASGVECVTQNTQTWKWNDGNGEQTLSGSTVTIPATSGKVQIIMNDECSIIIDDASLLGLSGRSIPLSYSIF